MNSAEKMLLSDAIEEAILANRKLIYHRVIIAALAILVLLTRWRRS